MFETYIETLLKERHKIVEHDRKLREKTELWQNQQNINRLNREINECATE